MLTRNKALRKLDLRWNNIGLTGGRALADALQTNTTLVELLVAGKAHVLHAKNDLSIKKAFAHQR